MKIFFDTEFTGLHKNTTLVSLGMVDDNGRTFYAEFSDYDKSQVDDWLKENVIDNLEFNNINNVFDYEISGDDTDINKANFVVKGSKEYVRSILELWLKPYSNVELVSDVCHYDMMLFVDIFGTAFDLPNKINPACHDINQDIAKFYDCSERTAFDMNRENIAGIHIDGAKHNALHDAQVIKKIYYSIV